MWSVLQLKHAKEKPDARQFCVICLEDTTDQVNKDTCLLRCGHTFCTECIEQLISYTHKKAKCPLCRQSLARSWTFCDLLRKCVVLAMSVTLLLFLIGEFSLIRNPPLI